MVGKLPFSILRGNFCVLKWLFDGRFRQKIILSNDEINREDTHLW